jgi:hypothetical protein
LWFAAIQGIKRKQDLTGLAPKGCLIAAQAIEREVGQIGKAQKAMRELNGRIDDRCDRIWLGTRSGLTGRFTGQTEYFGLKIRTKLHFVQYLLGFLAVFDRLKITVRDFRKTGKRRPKTGKFFLRHVRKTLGRFICFAPLGYRLSH